MWTDQQPPQAVLAEVPPLIGNRRQGPDLAEVGSSRSALWLKAHFMNPRAVSHDSIMPCYKYLFADQRGPDLVAYLRSLGRTHIMDRYELAAAWEPAKAAQVAAKHLDEAVLVKQFCSTCHSPNGATRRDWKSAFKILPPDLAKGPFRYVPATTAPAWRWRRFAEIIKFGLPGTDMPGHEYLPDDEIAAMAHYLTELGTKVNR